MSKAGDLVLDGGDPRLHSEALPGTSYAEKLHVVNNPNVSFEEYLHYASITRAEELNEYNATPKEKRTVKRTILGRFKKNDNPTPATISPAPSVEGPIAANEKKTEGDDVQTTGNPARASSPIVGTSYETVSDDEWRRLSRGIRTAGWSTCFYLITTDILGPFSTPWSFAQMGYGPGVALYTVFAVFAGLSGFYIWKIFLAMDSNRYPLRDYGAAFFRVYGPVARHCINFLQSLQLILTVAIFILSQGQSIAQVSAGTPHPVCFVVCLVIFALGGMIVSQIRTLQRFGWLANLAIWLNVTSIIICMAVAATSAPNFKATLASYGDGFGEGPVLTFAGTPPAGLASGGVGQPAFVASLNGLNQAVYSFGGAMLFFNFLSEMRHPWDFWKGFLVAQVFIYVVYIFFGIFMYSYQGQFSFNPAIQSLSPYRYQTTTNILYIIVGFIAAGLNSNIGVKVIYINIFQELFGAPALTTKSGKIIWIFIVPLYWSLAFVIAAAIPQFSFISGLVGAVCILSFTYTFPPLLHLGFQIKKDAMLPEESFDEATHTYTRLDGGFRRWSRGFMVKWHLNTFNTIYFLGALATCGLGTYSSVMGLIGAFNGTSVATSFGCTAPV